MKLSLGSFVLARLIHPGHTIFGPELENSDFLDAVFTSESELRDPPVVGSWLQLAA